MVFVLEVYCAFHTDSFFYTCILIGFYPTLSLLPMHEIIRQYIAQNEFIFEEATNNDDVEQFEQLLEGSSDRDGSNDGVEWAGSILGIACNLKRGHVATREQYVLRDICFFIAMPTTFEAQSNQNDRHGWHGCKILKKFEVFLPH